MFVEYTAAVLAKLPKLGIVGVCITTALKLEKELLLVITVFLLYSLTFSVISMRCIV